MWNMLWPMLVIVTSNTIYNVCAKSTPSDVNPFFSLAIPKALGLVTLPANFNMFFIGG